MHHPFELHGVELHLPINRACHEQVPRGGGECKAGDRFPIEKLHLVQALTQAALLNVPKFHIGVRATSSKQGAARIETYTGRLQARVHRFVLEVRALGLDLRTAPCVVRNLVL